MHGTIAYDFAVARHCRRQGRHVALSIEAGDGEILGFDACRKMLSDVSVLVEVEYRFFFRRTFVWWLFGVIVIVIIVVGIVGVGAVVIVGDSRDASCVGFRLRLAKRYRINDSELHRARLCDFRKVIIGIYMIFVFF